MLPCTGQVKVSFSEKNNDVLSAAVAALYLCQRLRERGYDRPALRYAREGDSTQKRRL